jgi:hypothetical protein
MSFGHFVLQVTDADGERLKRRTAGRAEATRLHLSVTFIHPFTVLRDFFPSI